MRAISISTVWVVLSLVSVGMAAPPVATAPPTATQARPAYLDPGKPLDARVEDLLVRLTLEEKVGLVHANGKFRAGGVPRLGVPPLWTSDGPQGIREELGIDSWSPAGWTSDFATAMPVGIALAATWNVQLAEAYGRTVAEEARARGKHVILGPALNIQRTPLCGRNYDYFGEDPWLAGRITVGYVKGMQAEQTIACLKHYALNNQETDRGTIDVQVEERPLREIYLPAFEAGVREGGALAIMGAYNKVRGTYAGHHDYLLNQVLKREWGFAGAVISDWSGTHDTREAVLNGLDLEMGTNKPYDQYFLARPFLAGIKSGAFSEALLNDKARRNLRMLIASGALDQRRPGSINTKAHHDVARAVATEGIVLLKNQPLSNGKAVLPLDLAKLKTIAVIGDNARRRFAAGGFSAGVKAFHEITALDGILERVGGRADVVFSQGYRQPDARQKGARDATGVGTSQLTGDSSKEAKALADRAVQVALRADAVLFVGGLTHQPGADEEGTDRPNLALPAHQDQLIARLVAANPRTAVILIAGGPVDMTAWIAKTPAIAQAWYGGSEGGNALAAVVFGDANPSGKLPCTFPKVLTDSPAHATGLARNFPGEGGNAEGQGKKVWYDEGLLVGYRWNEAKGVRPLFPFGHGLGYSPFQYAALRSSLAAGADGPSATISLDLTNAGEREGAEVVQVYVRPLKPPVERPVKELKAFAKVRLRPGEKRTVTVTLGPRAFAYYAPEARAWRIASGTYQLLVGASSQDIRLTASVEVTEAALLSR